MKIQKMRNDFGDMFPAPRFGWVGHFDLVSQILLSHPSFVSHLGQGLIINCRFLDFLMLKMIYFPTYSVSCYRKIRRGVTIK